MEYLTNTASCGCGQKQQQRNDLTGDTLVANISEILVELMPKEIRNLDVRSFWRKIRESPLLHQWVCTNKLSKPDFDNYGRFRSRRYSKITSPEAT